ncbi:hypothetical protein BDD43_0943 [Mucilaginibacter gracilis]|uniref:Uncharacterized protein n=1 Tax=Mucilaginibacter gracilis TaxID=423350 RepID=A0A495IXL0_9SPHI|nr:hypothetical protein [Mucilaginibacter gracilis]RKR80808.1 hypothetical protein BDD43_0943 [Mucilaginibacter gracilis]
MNDIEEKLWNYIDGHCTAEEEQLISHLIDTNEMYKQMYTELLRLNTEFKAIDLDEPSMAFTYNVMEAIRTEAALKPLKSAVNKHIIWAIGAFFAVSICALLVLMLASINWQQTGHVAINLPQFKMPPIQQYMSNNIMRGFLLFDMVLGLYVLDTYLRKKLNSKQQ